MQHDVTVAHLIERLSTCDPAAVVRMAINPDFPFAHYLGDIVETTDGNGQATVFLGEAGQQSYLPRSTAVALEWSVDPSLPRSARRAAGTRSGQ